MKLEIACTVRARLRGLLGRPGFDGVLMLVPCHDIHTFGMRESLDVAFVAADGTVLESHRRITPGRRLKNRQAAATLERFADSSPWFAPGDRIQSEFHLGKRKESPPRQASRLAVTSRAR